MDSDSADAQYFTAQQRSAASARYHASCKLPEPALQAQLALNCKAARRFQAAVPLLRCSSAGRGFDEFCALRDLVAQLAAESSCAKTVEIPTFPRHVRGKESPCLSTFFAAALIESTARL